MANQDVWMKIDPVEHRELNRFINTVISKSGDGRPLWNTYESHIHNSIHKNFREGGRPQRWAPLAESTIKARKRKGTWGKQGGQQILREHGTLERSIGSVNRKTAKTFEYGTNLEKAAFLQFGGTMPTGGKVPGRPYVVMQNRDIDTLIDYTWLHLLPRR